MCTVIAESWELLQLAAVERKPDEAEETWAARQAKALANINSRSLVLFHALVQVLLVWQPAPRTLPFCCFMAPADAICVEK